MESYFTKKELENYFKDFNIVRKFKEDSYEQNGFIQYFLLDRSFFTKNISSDIRNIQQWDIHLPKNISTVCDLTGNVGTESIYFASKPHIK